MTDDSTIRFEEQIADQVRSFLISVRDIAAQPDEDGVDEGLASLPYLLLEVSQLLLAGGRLGAISDVVPDERFEPDTGPDPDVEELRERLARLLAPVDDYVEIVDPMDPDRGADGFLISGDLASIASDLLHGLAHYHDGRTLEALWWWQFSYLSNWGQRALCAQRALLSMMSHQRLDADDVDMLAAEADALLADQE